MSNKFIFEFRSEDRRRPLPHKLIIGQNENESARHTVLKLLGFVLFYRERLEVEGKVHNDSIPFEPDLVQLDYTLRPLLWIECGDCGVNKLHKLAVKAPEAEIWILKGSPQEARTLLASIEKEELRTDRYQIIGFDAEMIQEMCGMVRARNELFWLTGGFDPPAMQFDFNGLWFDVSFALLKH
ncbi:MAG: YaeQ family protein [Verrucomicrobia bacterium]|nr:YaeQ family protein [Verrucomicrobiota bacterium]MBI3867616.1 YaeQ family protein [Verrucomicrobiota bacterium]